VGIGMTYFIAYELTTNGMSEIATLFKLKNEHVEMVHTERGAPRLIKLDNIYNDIYFVYVDSTDLRGRKNFVKMTFEHLWNETFVVRTFVDYYIYAFKLLYSKNFTHKLPRKITTIKELKEYVNQAIGDTFNEYEGKFGNNINKNKHYIVAVNYERPLFFPKTYIPPININVYIVNPISKEEAIRVIQENEVLLLWGLI
jgi:hypothetical protein